MGNLSLTSIKTLKKQTDKQTNIKIMHSEIQTPNKQKRRRRRKATKKKKKKKEREREREREN